MTSTSGIASPSTGLPTRRARFARGRTIVAGLLIVVVVLGVSLVVAGALLTPQISLTGNFTSRSPLNISMTPGARQFWFGIHDMGGTFHIVYYLEAQYSTGGLGEIELQIEGFTGNFGAYVLATQYNLTESYVDTFIHFPSEEAVNFTFVNNFPSNATVVLAILHVDSVTYPYEEIGSIFLYVGSALIVVDTGFALWWLLTAYRRKRNVIA